MKKILLLTYLISFLVFPKSFAQDNTYTDFATWYRDNYQKEIPSRAIAVFDYESKEPLYYYKENLVMPSASLMKLVSAGAFMKYTLNWNAKVALTYNDNEKDLRKYVGPRDAFALLRIKATDRITISDLFASMLIGSANNCANALPRILGLKKSDFIVKMNKTAKEWGMTNTTIDEMSGLSLKNTTTAHDMALAACNAFGVEGISKYSRSSLFNFTTKLGVKKNIKHTVYDLRNNPKNYFGAKTGYLTESQYHVAAGYITKNGKKICIAVMQTPTRVESEDMVVKIGEWVDNRVIE